MIQEIHLPEISEGIETAEVLQVLVDVGDFVQLEEAVVELETEKATFEAPASAAGQVVEILVQPGQQVAIGAALIKVDTDAVPGAAPAPAPPAEAQTEPVAPPPEPVAEEPKSQPPAPEPSQSMMTPAAAQSPATSSASAAPAVRQLADQLGVNIAQVTGTGPEGQILPEDVTAYAKGLITAPPTSAAAPVSAGPMEAKPLPDFSKLGPVKREKITTIRKKIAETLTYTWGTVPQVTQNDQADITLLEEFRKQYNPKVKEAGGKLTVTSILVKVISEALKQFPEFNASFDMAAQEIAYKQYYNISVAVDTERGLLVPVIRDVDKKSMLQVSIELTQLAEKTRNNKITPDDMIGGNFTISNLGGIGGTTFSPIIYWPQAAILGISRTLTQPVYVEGRLEPRKMLPLSLSYDHRLIDGTLALRFLRWVIGALENPFQLALDENAS